MIAQHPPNAEEARRNIRRLSAEIARLAKSDLTPDRFHAGFLDRVVRALAARGGVVWTLTDGVLRPTANIRLREVVRTETGDKVDGRHQQFVLEAFKARAEVAVAPGTGGAETSFAYNPTEFLALLQPITVDGACVGLVEVFHDANTTPAVQRGYREFLKRTTELAGDYLSRRRLEHLKEHRTKQSELDAFIKQVHASLNVQNVAFAAVNEGRRILGCDRMSLALYNGRRLKLTAVSGNETLNSRANQLRILERLAAVVVGTGDEFVSSGAADAPRSVDSQYDAYRAAGGADSVRITPLYEAVGQLGTSPEATSAVGAIIVEEFASREDASAADFDAASYAALCEATSSAAANARRFERACSFRLLRRWIERTPASRGGFPLRRLTMLLAAVVAAVVLTQVNAEFRVEGDGALVPELRRNVFAAESGVVREVPVDHGVRVATGDVVCRLENVELAVRLQQAKARLQQTVDEMQINESRQNARDVSTADRIRLEGAFVALEDRRESLVREIAILNRRVDALVVRAPIDGVVTTWAAERLLNGRPVEQGQRLVGVADDSGPWTLEIELPERRLGHMLCARNARESETDLEVEFILATEPERRYRGRIESVVGRTELNADNESVVMLTAVLEGERPPLRHGAEVRARVLCGKRPLWFVWFHEVVEFTQSRVLF